MSAKHTAVMRGAWRACSLAVLMIWTAGMALCASHCSLGTQRLFALQLSCHSVSDEAGSCAGGTCGGDAKKSNKSASVCFTLKHLFADTPQVVLTIPLVPAFDATAALHALVIKGTTTLDTSRRTDLRDWVFMPEVSLGPALRAHAPPLLS